MDKFKWAYIGCGRIADVTAKVITDSKRHEIVSCFNRTAAKAERFAAKYGCKSFDSAIEAVCADVDGVYIATTHDSHCDYSMIALQNKKPVLCEKPIAVNFQAGKTLFDYAKQSGLYLAEAMWTWFNEVAVNVKKWVDDKEVGDILSVQCDYAIASLLFYRAGRLTDVNALGGAMLDIGVYPIHYCYSLFGMPDKIVCNGKLKNGIDLSEKTVLSYNGFNATCNISFTRLGGDKLIIKGTKGTITVPSCHAASKAVLIKQGKKTVFRSNVHGVALYLTQFDKAAQEIREGKKASDFVTPQSTLSTLQIMDECRKQMGLVYPIEQIK